MRRSDLFLPASREARGAGTRTTRLLVRAGLIRSFGSGLWAFTAAGLRAREKVADRVRAGMDAVGGQEVTLPGLQYSDHWERSGRWENFEDEMFTLENRDGRAMCLAPSHEEGAVALLDGMVRSHEDLPLVVYQVGEKYRDDRAQNGLVRAKAFAMKDAYSFHADADSLAATYRGIRAAYDRTLTDLGLSFAVVDADAGAMGGSTSEEFVAPVAEGSTRLVACEADGCRFGVTDDHPGFDAHGDGDDCPDCGGRLRASDGIELAHVFRLDTRYSDAMGFTVDDDAGGEQPVRMGSYGVGVDRVLQTLVQQAGDDIDVSDGAGSETANGDNADACTFPVTDWGCVAPYRAAVIPVGDGEVQAVAESIHDDVGDDALLYDDEGQSVGERFAESSLLGLPAKVIVGNGYRETGLVDVERRDGTTEQVAPEEVADAVARFGAGRG